MPTGRKWTAVFTIHAEQIKNDTSRRWYGRKNDSWNYCSNHPSIEFVKDFDDIAEAIDYINTHPVDLIFLDIQLKNSSGFDLLQHVPSTTKVIITTSDSDNIEKAHSYHIDNILIKPITLESFLWSIKKLSDWLLTVEKLKQ